MDWKNFKIYDVLLNFMYFTPRIRSEALDQARKKFSEHVSDERFVKIPRDILLKIFEQDVIAPSQEIVCEAILKWIEHNKVDTAQGFRLILDTVKVSLLSLRYIQARIFPYASHLPDYNNLMILSQQLYLNKILMRTLDPSCSDNNNSSSSLEEEESNTSTTPMQKMSFIVHRGMNVTFIETLDLETRVWESIELPNTQCEGYGTAIFGEFLMIMGGIRSREIVNSAFIFNIESGAFIKIPSLHYARTDMGIAVINNPEGTDVYVIGGWKLVNEKKVLYKEVERWNSKLARWELVVSMNQPRASIIPAVLNGKIYVAGGYGSDLSSMEIYDPINDNWSSASKMTERRRFCTLVAHAGKIFAIGGSSNLCLTLLCSVEMYDPATDKWTAFTRIPQPTRCFAFSINNRLNYTAIDNSTPCLVEFDTSSRSWKKRMDIKVPNNFTAVHVHADENRPSIPRQQN